jgi:hypothetical protein
MELYTFNPSYAGGRNGKIMIRDQPRKKNVREILSQTQARCDGTHIGNPSYAGDR